MTEGFLLRTSSVDARSSFPLASLFGSSLPPPSLHCPQTPAPPFHWLRYSHPPSPSLPSLSPARFSSTMLIILAAPRLRPHHFPSRRPYPSSSSVPIRAPAACPVPVALLDVGPAVLRLRGIRLCGHGPRGTGALLHSRGCSLSRSPHCALDRSHCLILGLDFVVLKNENG
jgi:hypothetical protein